MDSLDMNGAVTERLNGLLGDVEAHVEGDVLTAFGAILPGVEHKIRKGIEEITHRRNTLFVLLQSYGGVVEVAERIVTVLRHHYDNVVFIVPDVAMSAGTVLAMSGDEIVMDYASCLGPIDPQVERDGKLVPARSYLLQYDALIAKATAGDLTTPEFAILQNYDQAELHSFKMACNLSIDLLVKWLSTYKFKDWTMTETQGNPVTAQMREERALEVANKLMKHERWGSHSRGISMQVLREEINLRIDDLAADATLHTLVRQYSALATDVMVRNGLPQFTHSRAFV